MNEAMEREARARAWRARARRARVRAAWAGTLPLMAASLEEARAAERAAERGDAMNEAMIPCTPDFLGLVIDAICDVAHAAARECADPDLHPAFSYVEVQVDRAEAAELLAVLRCRRVQNADRLSAHVCEMPRALCEKIIKCWTKPGDLIIDPCCGSGALLTYAHAMGRRVEGWEINPAMAEHARAALVSGGRPLAARHTEELFGKEQQ